MVATALGICLIPSCARTREAEPASAVAPAPAAGIEAAAPPAAEARPPTGAEPTAPLAAPAAVEDGLPAPVAVCVEQPDGTLVRGTARPSRAGVYDPSVAAVPEHLNWMVDGQGCVGYPGGASRRASCGPGGEAAPVVGRTLCAQ